jgi:uncharacterized protein (TIGR02266 family)
MEEEKRRFPRIKTNIKTTYQYSGVTVRAEILNVSSNGIFIKTNYPPPIDSTLYVHFHFPGDPEPLDIEGQVVWVKQTIQAAFPGMGIQFNKISPVHKERIQAFVESHMIN